MTGALGSSPMPGCRNRSGRPCPFSTTSRRMPLTVMAAAQSCNVIFPAARDFHSISLLYYAKSAAPMEIRRVGWVVRQRNPSRRVYWKNDGFRCRTTHPTVGDYVTDQTCEIHSDLTYATHDGVELK